MRTIKLTEETRKDLLEKSTEEKPELLWGIRRPGDRRLSTRSGQRATRRCSTTPSVSTGQRSRCENIRVTEDEIKTAYEDSGSGAVIRHPEGSGQHPFLP